MDISTFGTDYMCLVNSALLAKMGRNVICLSGNSFESKFCLNGYKYACQSLYDWTRLVSALKSFEQRGGATTPWDEWQ